MTRVVFLDVDGTMLDHNQELPRSARDALEAAVRAGHQLVMCTGRSKPEIYPFLWDIGFKGLVGCNGAYAEIDGNTISDMHLSEDEVAEITDWFAKNRISATWLTGTTIHPLSGIEEVFGDAEGNGGAISGDWSSYVRLISPYLRDDMPRVAPKATFYIPPEAELTVADVQDHYRDRFVVIPGSLPDPDGEVGEITMRNMDKSVGMQKVAEKLGVSLEDVIAVGDSSNDIEMLERAGTSVAMGNGTPEAKQAADWVTRSIDDDGIAAAFQKLGLLD